MSTTFKFSAVVEFEIDPDTAAALLVELPYHPRVGEWISEHHPIREQNCIYNAGSLKEALGRHLANNKVNECRQLTLSSDNQPTT